MSYFRAVLTTARFWCITLLLGIAIGLSVYGAMADRLIETDETPPPPGATLPISATGQIPYWLGFYNRALWDRTPIYYCLAGQGWTQDDHDAAHDGFTAPWGWAKVDRTIAVQIQERCNEILRANVLFVMDSAFVQNYCQPNVGFIVVACVSFEDWIYRDGVWMYGKAIVHVEPYRWAIASHAWRALILIHEFGHAAFSLNDTPNQAAGVTSMDYCYEVSYGMLPYPTAADIAVVDALHGSTTTGYKDPAWFCGVGGCPVRK